MISHYPALWPPGVLPTHISILETSTNFTYNAVASLGSGNNLGSVHTSDRYAQRFSVSYVTGSHAFKVGFSQEEGVRNTGTHINGDVQYQFLNGAPVSLTEFATPYLEKERIRSDLGMFAQDQWRVQRLTLNYGLRVEYFNGYIPKQQLPAGPFVPARDFAAVYQVPNWWDANPRLGASYDLFGTGKTALKVSLGRYVGPAATGLILLSNPLTTSVNSVRRSWTDTNGNYVPDCILSNPAKNGECGALANQEFGKNNAAATRYADDLLHGFAKRDTNWDFGAEIQHELRLGMSMTAGYYRSWYGNFQATDNLAVTRADFDHYCIKAPVDPGLPGGGGYQVCGLYDISNAKFGQVTNLVTNASDYGKQTRVNDFFGVSVSSRFRSGMRLGGGIDTGRTVTDACFVVDSPQALQYCRVVTPWPANTQVKLNGSYPLPMNFVVSGILQNVTGPNITANYPAPTALIAPSLGRNLAGGTRTATVALIEPQTLFEPRRTQIDLRLTKIFNIGSTRRVQVNFDAYNLLNANTILGINSTYGSQWRRPTSVLDGRLIELSSQLSF